MAITTLADIQRNTDITEPVLSITDKLHKTKIKILTWLGTTEEIDEILESFENLHEHSCSLDGSTIFLVNEVNN